MAQKFYAIKNTNQIVKTWDECKAVVDGLSGAKYKSFKTKDEALSYLLDEVVDAPKSAPKLELEVVNYISDNGISGTITYAETVDPFTLPLSGTVFAVDGSFNTETKVYGAGIVQYDNEQNIVEQKSAAGSRPEFAQSRNVAGEILAFATTIAMATEQQLSEITVICDYEGDFRWAAPKTVIVNDKPCWGNKKSSPIAEYHAKAMNYAKQNGIDKIHFVWVKGHKGIASNEAVDVLAKKACGLA